MESELWVCAGREIEKLWGRYLEDPKKDTVGWYRYIGEWRDGKDLIRKGTC